MDWGREGQSVSRPGDASSPGSQSPHKELQNSQLQQHHPKTHVWGSRILCQRPREYHELALYSKDTLQQSGPSLSNLKDMGPTTNSQADCLFEPQSLQALLKPASMSAPPEQ